MFGHVVGTEQTAMSAYRSGPVQPGGIDAAPLIKNIVGHFGRSEDKNRVPKEAGIDHVTC